MAFHGSAVLLLGYLLFTAGVLARAYENRKIRQLTKYDGNFYFTEGVYWSLIKAGQAPSWPLIVVIICTPLGILISIIAILMLASS
jgi:hypothetical protein